MTVFAIILPYEGAQELYRTREAAEAALEADPYWTDAYIEEMTVN
jgi:uncharacterized protein YciI